MKRKLLSMLFVVVLCLSFAVSAFAASGADIYDHLQGDARAFIYGRIRAA